jgi:cytochrome c
VRSKGFWLWAFWALVAALTVAGCATLPQTRPQTVSRGDPAFGKQALIDYGCIACHVIPGVPGADSYVGPPLDRFGQRSYIAGALANNQDNLVRWVMNPQAVEPGTVMPDLGVSEEDAINIAAYLLSLD